MPGSALSYINRFLSPTGSIRRSSSIAALPTDRSRSPGFNNDFVFPFPLVPDAISTASLAPPRILLLGASGSGKTTFLDGLRSFTTSTVIHSPPRSSRLSLRRVSSNTFQIPSAEDEIQSQPCGVDVEEINITPTQTAILSDIEAADARRILRLHFSPAITESNVGILFFIDVLEPLEQALEELAYVATYTKERIRGRLRFVGVVLSKVDLVPLSTEEKLIAEATPVASVIASQRFIVDVASGDSDRTRVEGRRNRVERIQREVREVLEPVLKGETTYQVIAGQDIMEWSLKSEESVRELVDLLGARMQGIKFLRRAGPSVAIRGTAGKSQRRWRSTRDVNAGAKRSSFLETVE